MKLKYLLSAAILALGLASCSNEAEQANGGEKTPLQITASIESTRAAGIEDREFKSGEYIGFFVGDRKDAWNVLATYNTDEKRWMLDNGNIMLDGQERLVRAYYPYDEFGTMENFMGFQVFAGVNHLVSNSEYVWNSHPTAELKFRHLMARVKFVVNNPEKLELSNITLSGKNIYSTGLYYFEKEYISLWNNEPVVVENTNEDKTMEVQSIDALLIPANAGEVELTLNFAEGKKYTTTVSLPELKQGGYYQLPITLKDASTPEEHEYVDLGLPSGTLWATCNVGAEKPEGYGDYFAWGETSPKEKYDYETYKWCNGTSSSFTKYNSNSKYGTVDNKTVLEPEDDAAHVNWGGTWRMPTDSEIQELIDNCTWTWTTLNGISGFNVEGYNGNFIFLPAAGCYWDTSAGGMGEIGYYWSNTASSQFADWARRLSFQSWQYVNDEGGRGVGKSIRPVCSK